MTQTLEELIKVWDGQAVVTHYDAPTGTWIFIAIHDLTLGMGCGGCRMKVYPTPTDGLRDALRLARGMTAKWAAVDMDFGVVGPWHPPPRRNSLDDHPSIRPRRAHYGMGAV